MNHEQMLRRSCPVGEAGYHADDEMRVFSIFLISFSLLLEVGLIVVAYLACKGAPPRDDMPNFVTMGISVIGSLTLAIIFFSNIAFASIGKTRTLGHLVIALTSIVGFAFMVCIFQHFGQ